MKHRKRAALRRRGKTAEMLREVVRTCGVEYKERRAVLCFAHRYDLLLRRAPECYFPGSARRLFMQYCCMGLSAQTLWAVGHEIEARRLSPLMS